MTCTASGHGQSLYRNGNNSVAVIVNNVDVALCNYTIAVVVAIIAIAIIIQMINIRRLSYVVSIVFDVRAFIIMSYGCIGLHLCYTYSIVALW